MNADFSYHCSNCKTLLSRVFQGMCPVCGSQSVIPVGWYQLSTRERREWLQRIRGQRRNGRQQPDAGSD